MSKTFRFIRAVSLSGIFVKSILFSRGYGTGGSPSLPSESEMPGDEANDENREMDPAVSDHDSSME
jgi:hypothetical protein